MLVPKRSVCVSIATSARMSSSWTRRARFAKRFESRLARADFTGHRAQLLGELRAGRFPVPRWRARWPDRGSIRLRRRRQSGRARRAVHSEWPSDARASRAPAAGPGSGGRPLPQTSATSHASRPPDQQRRQPADDRQAGRRRAVVAGGIGIAPAGGFEALLQSGHLCGLSLGPLGDLIGRRRLAVWQKRRRMSSAQTRPAACRSARRPSAGARARCAPAAATWRTTSPAPRR